MINLENGLMAAYERWDRYRDPMREEERTYTEVYCRECGREQTEAECAEDGEWHAVRLCEECWQAKIDRGEIN